MLVAEDPHCLPAVKSLLAAKADPGLLNKAGRSAFAIAEAVGNTAAAELLLPAKKVSLGAATHVTGADASKSALTFTDEKQDEHTTPADTKALQQPQPQAQALSGVSPKTKAKQRGKPTVKTDSNGNGTGTSAADAKSAKAASASLAAAAKAGKLAKKAAAAAEKPTRAEKKKAASEAICAAQTPTPSQGGKGKKAEESKTKKNDKSKNCRMGDALAATGAAVAMKKSVNNAPEPPPVGKSVVDKPVVKDKDAKNAKGKKPAADVSVGVFTSRPAGVKENVKNKHSKAQVGSTAAGTDTAPKSSACTSMADFGYCIDQGCTAEHRQCETHLTRFGSCTEEKCPLVHVSKTMYRFFVKS
jgi:hypothetical protein